MTEAFTLFCLYGNFSYAERGPRFEVRGFFRGVGSENDSIEPVT